MDVAGGEIDWSRPWLAPWRACGEGLEAQARRVGVVDALNALTTAANTLCAGRLRFVDQSELPAGEAYEAFIARTARVPTRDNLHDLLNGLGWLVNPALKRRLNEGHAAQLAKAEPGRPRCAVRDALTLLDENAAFFQAPPVLVEALARRDWYALFVRHRAAWVDARIELFGHALIEKLVRPRAAITAHVWVVPRGIDSMGDWLAGSLTLQGAAARPFAPLPVLGVPGWWVPNESTGFYDDADVFRPAPRKTATLRPLF